MAKYVFEVIEEAASKKTKKEKVDVLKQNATPALKDVLRGTFDSTIVFLLPEGSPPYTACEEHNAPSNLLKKNREFGYFVKGGPGQNMPKFKREQIFIRMLEAVHPQDAELLIQMINKKAPKGLTRKTVEEAFPDLLKDST
jgi:hypothetical protein